MTKRKKVSIILPCYNGEDTIQRALYGVIKQSYRPIELILVNDGSTDNTMGKINEMEACIKNAGIDFVCISQNNMGLGGAINTGLKRVTGKYLAWVDADDELLPLSVEKRVDFLDKNPQFGTVSSNAYMAEDREWEHPIGILTNDKKINSDPDQFEFMLTGKSIFCSGCHLVRTDLFIEANNGLEIYPARHGQNWQMLLPVYYCSKHAFIDEPLYKYRVNANNMSATIDKMSARDLYKRREEYLEIVKHTLERINGMPTSAQKKYWNSFKEYIYSHNLVTAAENNRSFDYIVWRCKLLIVTRKFNTNFSDSYLVKHMKSILRKRKIDCDIFRE